MARLRGVIASAITLSPVFLVFHQFRADFHTSVPHDAAIDCLWELAICRYQCQNQGAFAVSMPRLLNL